MALITCPECASAISDKAASCPKCGYPIAQTPIPSFTQQETTPAAPVEEQIIFAIHPSRKVLIGIWILVAFWVLLFWLPMHNVEFVGGVMSFMVVIMLIMAGVAHLRRKTTLYTLTTEHMMFKTGIVGRVEKSIPLARVQNITSEYGVLQSFFGIGTNVIESAGELTGRVYMRNVDTPLSYRNQILDAVKAASQRPQAAARI